MNINRRKFFRVVAAGVAAASIPAFLKPEKIQGKIVHPTPNGEPRAGFYAWQEQGDAGPLLWNIKDGCDHDVESLAQAMRIPIRKGLMSKDMSSFPTIR